TGLRVAHLGRAEVGGVIQHDTWVTVGDVLDRFARYTHHEAHDMLKAKQKYSTRRALHAAWSQFAGIYFGQHTYRDGVPGLFYALGMAMYRLLVWMHLWEMEGRLPVHDTPAAKWGTAIAQLRGGRSRGLRIGRSLVR